MAAAVSLSVPATRSPPGGASMYERASQRRARVHSPAQHPHPCAGHHCALACVGHNCATGRPTPAPSTCAHARAHMSAAPHADSRCARCVLALHVRFNGGQRALHDGRVWRVARSSVSRCFHTCATKQQWGVGQSGAVLRCALCARQQCAMHTTHLARRGKCACPPPPHVHPPAHGPPHQEAQSRRPRRMHQQPRHGTPNP